MDRSTLNSSYERRSLYRTRLVDLDALEDTNDVDKQVKKAADAVMEASELHANTSIEELAKNPSEIYLDSKVLRHASNVAYRSAESFSGNVDVYNSTKLSMHIRMNPNFWTFMLPKEAPPMHYLYGTFDPTPREQRPRVPRRVQQKQQVKTVKAPANVEKLHSSEDKIAGWVHRFMMREYRQKSKQPLSYFHLVLDPESFSSTVENIHYVSFLVHDGLAGVEIDEKYGLPFITPYSKTDDLHDQRDIVEQLIISMDHQRWRALIQAFNIRKPMMVLPS